MNLKQRLENNSRLQNCFNFLKQAGPQTCFNIVKKAGPLAVIYGADVGSVFIRTYLLSKKDINLLKAAAVVYSTTNIVAISVPFLFSQDAIFIAEKYGRIKALESQDLNQASFDPEEYNALREDIGVIIRQGWLASAGAGVISAAVLFGLGNQLVKIFSQPDDVNEIAYSYIQIFAFSLPAEFMLKISERFLSAVDEEKWIIPYRLCTFGLQTGLNFALIPQFGMRGAAYAALAKSLCGSVGLSLFLGVKSNFRQYKILKLKLGDLNYIKDILKQGLPIFISQLFLMGSSFAISAFMGHLQKNRIVVEQILIQSFSLSEVFNMSISESTNRITAQHFGARDYRSMRKTGNTGLVMNTVTSTIFSILFIALSDQISDLFLSEDDVDEDLSPVVRYTFMIMSVAYIFRFIYDTSYNNLSAVNDTFFAPVTNFMLTYLVSLPLCALSTYLTDFDIYGISSPIALNFLMVSLLASGYWFAHSNKLVANDGLNVETSNTRFANCFHGFFSKRHRGRNVTDNIEVPTQDENDRTQLIKN